MARQLATELRTRGVAGSTPPTGVDGAPNRGDRGRRGHSDSRRRSRLSMTPTDDLAASPARGSRTCVENYVRARTLQAHADEAGTVFPFGPPSRRNGGDTSATGCRSRAGRRKWRPHRETRDALDHSRHHSHARIRVRSPGRDVPKSHHRQAPRLRPSDRQAPWRPSQADLGAHPPRRWASCFVCVETQARGNHKTDQRFIDQLAAVIAAHAKRQPTLPPARVAGLGVSLTYRGTLNVGHAPPPCGGRRFM
jgi:hypothetical protein